MADPVRERIFAAIESLLSAMPGVAEVERMPSSDPAAFPALHIFDNGDSPDPEEAGTSRWLMSVRIEGYVQGGDGPEAHAAANALYADVIEVLFVEPVLGGLATEIEQTGLRPSVANLARARRIGFDLPLSIYYATARGEPRSTD